MNKPITVTYESFKQELAALINSSGLPAFIIEAVLQNYLNEVRSVMQQQFNADLAEYEKSLQEKSKSEE